MNVIACNKLTKSYGNINAVNNLTVQIEENKITGLIGRNGAGKTTLLKIIAGYIRETSGEIKVFSKRPFNSLLVSANMIFIHNQMNLPAALTLKEILVEGARFYKNWNSELANRLFDYFSFHPMQHFDGLSTGMQSTFRAIFGLASRTPLTIFDEPTTGMDAAVRKDFYRAMLKDYIAHPRTIILSSHHLEEIEDLLEDILLLQDGKVLLHLPVSDLKEWAVGLGGNNQIIAEWIRGREVIFQKSNELRFGYAMVKNDFTEEELRDARLAGVEVSPVTTTDLCVYLTGKTKGGIDDVFN